MAKILIVDDDIMICRILDQFLKRKGHETTFFTSGKKALEDLKVNIPEIVFCDYRLPDTDGKEMLQKIKEVDHTIQVIVITAYSDIKIAVELIKRGAFEYATKPLLPEEIVLMVDNALHLKAKLIKQDGKNPGVDHDQVSVNKQGRSTTDMTKHSSSSNYIVGKSKEALKLQSQIELVAPTNYSVILYGETGTGKESVAYSIHMLSPRKDKPFVAVDCGALTKELAGSELFGHEKGAFTGALQSKIGQFEMANGGTIFLDEITNLSYDIQISLLRVIQERKIRRLGSAKEAAIDVRIIVASNEMLSKVTMSGKFREDLYHRLNEFSIDLPSLRERNIDIMLFADFFLKNVNAELEKNIEGFSPETQKVLMEYKWPGNLREMNNVIKRAALLTNKGLIGPETLPKEIVFQSKFNLTDDTTTTTTGQSATYKTMPELKTAALSAEYQKILEVLREVNYNKSKAAMILNIDRKTLYNKVKSYNLLTAE
jgi:two-component system response regulator HydG